MVENNFLASVKETSCRRIRYLMGCFVEIEAHGDHPKQSEKAVEEAFSEMKRIEYLLSKFLPDSVVSHINQSAGKKAVRVSEEVFELIQRCLHFSEFTKGTFDITVNPLTTLWQQAEKEGRLPAIGDVQKTLSLIGWRFIELDLRTGTIFLKHSGMKIDLGAVGKGYAVDRAVDVLRRHGIQKGLVSTGSNIFCLNKKGQKFGIAHPLDPGKVISLVELTNQSISTSGNYERYVEIAGDRYGHLIDFRTGHPSNTNVLSVSVMADSAMEGDILSTAAFISGYSEGEKMLKSFKTAESVFVLSSGPSLDPQIVRSSEYSENKKAG